jgi:hypothetical protein
MKIIQVFLLKLKKNISVSFEVFAEVYLKILFFWSMTLHQWIMSSSLGGEDCEVKLSSTLDNEYASLPQSARIQLPINVT